MHPSPSETIWRRSSALLISSGSKPPNRQRSRRDGFHQPSRAAFAFEPIEIEDHLHRAVVALAQVHHPIGGILVPQTEQARWET